MTATGHCLESTVRPIRPKSPNLSSLAQPDLSVPIRLNYRVADQDGAAGAVDATRQSPVGVSESAFLASD